MKTKRWSERNRDWESEGQKQRGTGERPGQQTYAIGTQEKEKAKCKKREAGEAAEQTGP